jgi:hypothetical protein
MDKLKIIKFFVFVMTILLVAGIIAAAIGLAIGKKDKKVAETTFDKTAEIPFLQENEEVAADVWLGEYQGSEIKDFKSCGKDLCVLIVGGDQEDRIFVVSRQGKIIQRLHIGEKPNNQVTDKNDDKLKD